MPASFDITPNDYAAFTAYQQKQPKIRQRYLVNNLIYAAIGTAAYIYFYLRNSTVPHTTSSLAMFIGTLIAFICVLTFGFTLIDMIYVRFKVRRNSKLEHVKLTPSPDGILISTIKGDHLWKWTGISRIVETNKYIFCYTSETAALIIPKRAFTHANEVQDFLTMAQASHRAEQRSSMESIYFTTIYRLAVQHAHAARRRFAATRSVAF
jgi:hypothetical protein